MKTLFLLWMLGVVAFCAPSVVTAQTSPARQPFGIYAKPNIDSCVTFNGIDTDADECVSNSVAELLNNPAVSGVAAYVRWSDLWPSVNPQSTNSTAASTNWGITDAVFAAAEQYNLAHSNQPPKTVQLGIIPGFHTPQWILNQMVPCDAMFTSNGVNTNLVPGTCGCATFLSGEGEFATVTNALLPLPWNPIYTNYWYAFVHDLAQRYGNNPLLLSVCVAGPTSDSDEMILPNESNNPTNYWKWNSLFSLSFPTNYQNSDLAFIEAWDHAIDVYAEAFSNITLVVTTGNGLPNFTNAQGVPYPTYAVPPGFAWDCTTGMADLMDAASECTVLAYFADPRHGGDNAKSTQEDGLRAREINFDPLAGNLGSSGIKYLAQYSASGSNVLPGGTNVVSRVLGGLQFDTSVVSNPWRESCNVMNGCPTNEPGPSPEQGFYNVFQVYFDGTPFGASYGTNTVSGNIPLNYMQIYSTDIFYASTNADGTNIVNGFGNTNFVTAESELTNASWQIFHMAEAVLYMQPVSNTLQVVWPGAASGYQLQFNDNLSKPDAWKTNANTSTPTVSNGFYQVQINTAGDARFYRLMLP
jgi:hypothetical protein